MPKGRIKRNRFAGSDAVYSTKKFFVREDVSTLRNGTTVVSKRYIRKSPTARKELEEIWGTGRF